ncbi:MAG: type I polyketide synthase, partial [Verrucomicrobiota bacterium]
MNEQAGGNREPIAIAGIGCRLPGGIESPGQLWNVLIKSRCLIEEIPESRWTNSKFHHRDPATANRMVASKGGFVKDFAKFDAEFFSISPREASRMDPQHRWLLECAWEAFEDAGIPPAALRGTRTGVFLGLSNSDYGKIQSDFHERLDGYTNIGNSLSIASNRLSYFFDFQGPSLTVDTACSSSLVAVSLACERIWRGDCEGALTGGASCLVLPDGSIGFSKAGMLSPTGLCRAFDRDGDGYVRSEGAGVFLLLPLSKARDLDCSIYGTIRSAIINQDGHTSSITVPSVSAQRAMTEAALQEAEVAPEEIAYIEAHGTGTPVGDPIEAMALGEALRGTRPRSSPCLIGSVKTNLGHLEPASGVAGLLKVALILRNGTIPPSLHFDNPNPRIPFEELRLKVVTESTPLTPGREGAGIVGVNSFGFGGTNSQLILAQVDSDSVAPETETLPPRLPYTLSISARSNEALRDLSKEYAALLREEIANPAEICVSAAMKRACLPYRLVATGVDVDSLARTLERFHGEGSPSDTLHHNFLPGNSQADPVFVFAGQGSQWWGMARMLLSETGVFRDTVIRISEKLEKLAHFSLIEELMRSEGESRIDLTEIAQPGLFAIQMGLVNLWESWGVSPKAVVGHSVGEAAAACSAGIFSEAESVELIYHRSRCQGMTRGSGRMLAAALSFEAATELVESSRGRLSIASFNSPTLVTFSGVGEEIEKLKRTLADKGTFARALPIDYAFHSPAMDPIEAELKRALKKLKPSTARIPFLSTVTGAFIEGSELDVDYWWRNVRDPVLFEPAISSLPDLGHVIALEIGPHPSLGNAIRECLSVRDAKVTTLHSLKRETDDFESLASSLVGLSLNGIQLEWKQIYQTNPVSGGRLPLYPWQRR